jgi:hypothetical protein
MKEAMEKMEGALKNSMEDLSEFVKQHGIIVALVLIMLYLWKRGK